MIQSLNQSFNSQSIVQSHNQSFKQSISQSINQSAIQTFNQSIKTLTNTQSRQQSRLYTLSLAHKLATFYLRIDLKPKMAITFNNACLGIDIDCFACTIVKTYRDIKNTIPAKSPVAAERPRKYPVGSSTPTTSKHSVHFPSPSTSCWTF